MKLSEIIETPRYEVRVFTAGNNLEPALNVQTENGYNIEGDFLCVYRNGIKEAFRLPLGTTYITAVEVVKAPNPLEDPLETLPSQPNPNEDKHDDTVQEGENATA